MNRIDFRDNTCGNISAKNLQCRFFFALYIDTVGGGERLDDSELSLRSDELKRLGKIIVFGNNGSDGSDVSDDT